MFSGGVESTALLHLLNPVEDYVGIIDFHCRFANSFDHNLDMQHKILMHYGIHNISVCSMKMDYVKNMVHGDTSGQYQPFASLFAERLPHLTEVWWGCHKTDTHDDEKWSRYREAWALMHPTCKVRQPLEHLTKKEQWELIDDEVKPFVISCYTKYYYPDNHNEANCRACADERKKYSGE